MESNHSTSVVPRYYDLQPVVPLAPPVGFRSSKGRKMCQTRMQRYAQFHFKCLQKHLTSTLHASSATSGTKNGSGLAPTTKPKSTPAAFATTIPDDSIWHSKNCARNWRRSGMGRAVALAFQSAGYSVVLTGRRGAELERTSAQAKSRRW
jgi:hypothetical protein